MDEVNLVRLTLSWRPRGGDLLLVAVEEVHLVVGSMDDVDIVLVPVDKVDLVLRSVDEVRPPRVRG